MCLAGRGTRRGRGGDQEARCRRTCSCTGSTGVLFARREAEAREGAQLPSGRGFASSACLHGRDGMHTLRIIERFQRRGLRVLLGGIQERLAIAGAGGILSLVALQRRAIWPKLGARHTCLSPLMGHVNRAGGPIFGRLPVW